MSLLGVDPGGRRIGLAVGDPATGVAVPVAVVEVTSLAAAAELVCGEATKRQVVVVVVGLPTDEEGRETPACRRSHRLAGLLSAAGLEVRLQPELLSSHEASRRARDAGRRTGTPIDDLAAQVLLEDFMAAAATSSRRPR